MAKLKLTSRSAQDTKIELDGKDITRQVRGLTIQAGAGAQTIVVLELEAELEIEVAAVTVKQAPPAPVDFLELNRQAAKQ